MFACVKLKSVTASLSISHCFKATTAFTTGSGFTTKLNEVVEKQPVTLLVNRT